MKKIALLALVFMQGFYSHGQTKNLAIPAVLSNLHYNSTGVLVLKNGTEELPDLQKTDAYTLSQMMGKLRGTELGIALDINRPGYNGTVAYGPLNENASYPAIAFLPKDIKLIDGKAVLEIKKTFTKANDFFSLAAKGKGVLGYRIMDSAGRIIYEGRAAFRGTGPYEVLPTITEGPMINNLQPDGGIISFETSEPLITRITVGNKIYTDEKAARHHEITVQGLQPSTAYDYSIAYGDRTDKHRFTTAHAAGSRRPFTFAFASANRSTTGGGERDFGGVNYQSTRSIMAVAVMNGAAFMQVQGDITNGANTTEDAHLMEYANFKRALEPFWEAVPVYVGFGDHEPNKKAFAPDSVTKKSKTIEVFPYATASGEAVFANAFVHPQNGPLSEDGAAYDPDKNNIDFPTYKENVYYYTYDNVAMIVLNTEYWESKDPLATSGCPEGYIMDQQVAWLKETVAKMEKNPSIDHVFVVVHGALFPNGDHLADAMWWNGNNSSRAVVRGIPLSKGTIERRDEILDICVNQSKKFLSFISGDEHNFSFLQLTPLTTIYLPGYTGKKLVLSRSVYTINNGGGGSAPYAMLPSPWSKGFQYFTEPPVMAMIAVNGKSVTLKAVKAETFESICQDVKLR